MSETTRVTLVGGPLAGYIHEADEVGELIPLRFNGVRPNTQHVYHFGGSSPSGVIYEYKGDDETTLGALPSTGIDVPAHAFGATASPRLSPKDQYAAQLADEELDSWGEGARRDFLEGR